MFSHFSTNWQKGSLSKKSPKYILDRSLVVDFAWLKWEPKNFCYQATGFVWRQVNARDKSWFIFGSYFVAVLRTEILSISVEIVCHKIRVKTSQCNPLHEWQVKLSSVVRFEFLGTVKVIFIKCKCLSNLRSMESIKMQGFGISHCSTTRTSCKWCWQLHKYGISTATKMGVTSKLNFRWITKLNPDFAKW